MKRPDYLKDRLEGVIFVGFDLDGTLYKDTQATHIAVRSTIYSKLSAALGISYEEAEQRFQEEFKETESGSKTIASLLDISSDQATEIMQDCLAEANIVDLLRYDLGLRMLFDNLRKARILITSSNQFRASRILHKLGLSEVDFHFKTYKDSEGPVNKSNGEVFRYYKKMLNLERHASRFVYVGDSEKRDILPAKKVGFRTVFVGDEDSPNATRSIRTIYDLEYLL